MSIVNIFTGSYCYDEGISKSLVNKMDYQYITDDDILAKAEERFHIPAKKLLRSMYESPSIFNKFTHEKERFITFIKMSLLETLKKDNIIYVGFVGYLLPPEITHALKVCIIADLEFRISRAVKKEGLTEKEARRSIQKNDEKLNTWTQHLFSRKPWDSFLYDMVIPIDKTRVDEAAQLIISNLSKDVVKTTDKSQQAMDDFILASMVEIALVEKGHDVEVACQGKKIIITINKKVLRLEHLENELKKIALEVSGVSEVTTRVGPNYYKADTYRKYDFDMPSKVLLVDDERDFVQTLSRRLQMRDLGSAAVYDGEKALNLLSEEEPDVMVLDLRMPGINGMEVLRRVKKERPETEVIILTGHGSKNDEKQALELGAFAYLNKPVDINVLVEKMKEAQKKVNAARAIKKSI